MSNVTDGFVRKVSIRTPARGVTFGVGFNMPTDAKVSIRTPARGVTP